MAKRKVGSEPSSLSTCPLCGKFVGSSFLPFHASSCCGKAPARPDLFTPPERRYVRGNQRRTRPRRGGPPTERGAPGFHVFENVLSEVEEARLLDAVEAAPGTWMDFKARRVRSYGPPWSHAEKRLLHECDGVRPTPLPMYVEEVVMPIVRNVVPRSVYDACPNQLCLSVYSGVESFILPHSDEENDRLDAPILGLSLQAGTTMTLALPKALSPTGAMVKADVLLPRRSLYVMSGDALHSWHHGIFAGKTKGTRYSLTLRVALPPSVEQQEARIREERSQEVQRRTLPGRKRMRQSRLP